MKGRIAALILIACTGAADPAASRRSPGDDPAGAAQRFAGRWKLHIQFKKAPARLRSTRSRRVTRSAARSRSRGTPWNSACPPSPPGGKNGGRSRSSRPATDSPGRRGRRREVRRGPGKSPTVKVTSKEIWRLVGARHAPALLRGRRRRATVAEASERLRDEGGGRLRGHDVQEGEGVAAPGRGQPGMARSSADAHEKTRPVLDRAGASVAASRPLGLRSLGAGAVVVVPGGITEPGWPGCGTLGTGATEAGSAPVLIRLRAELAGSGTRSCRTCCDHRLAGRLDLLGRRAGRHCWYPWRGRSSWRARRSPCRTRPG